MASQYLFFQIVRSIVGTAVAGLGLVVLFVELDGLAVMLSSLAGIAGKAMRELLPYFVHAACQLLQAFVLDHLRFSALALQVLGLWWPLLHSVSASI
jgi:hypothetical protein